MASTRFRGQSRPSADRIDTANFSSP
jgi:hypothetical protein